MSTNSKSMIAPRIEDRNRAHAALALLANGPVSLSSLYEALGIETERDRVAFRATLTRMARAKVSIYGSAAGAKACIGDPPPKQATLPLAGRAQQSSDYDRVVELLAKDCARLIHEAYDDGFPVNASELKAFCKNDREWEGVKRLLKNQGFKTGGSGSSLWTVGEAKETDND